MRNCPSSGFLNEELRTAAGTLICSSHGPLTTVAEEKVHKSVLLICEKTYS